MNLEFDLGIPAFPEIRLSNSDQTLHDEALAASKVYKRAEARLLEIICSVETTRLFEKFRLTTTHAYCLKYLDLPDALAYHFVGIARKSRTVPELKAAIQSGDLTVSKAARIVSVVTPENKTEWIEKAMTMSKHQIEKEVVKTAPEAPTYERVKPMAPGKSKMEVHWDDELIQDLRRAQELESQRTGNFETLESTLRRILKVHLEKNDPVKKAERNVNKKPNSARAEKSGRAPMASGSAKHSAKHQRETIPAAIIHQINIRDQRKCHARLPDGSICGSRHWVQTHHIIEVANGGTNALENLITVCSAHHRQWHKRL